MKCAECLYWWKDEDEKHPSCHADPNFPAPCEIEEEEAEEEPELDEED
jgi:hypothetical protein